MTNPIPHSFKGIIPPMITPLLEDQTLDLKSLNLITEHLIKGGVHGIFILGTTGESSSFSLKLKEQLIQETFRIVDGRVNVLVGMTDSALETSIYLGETARKYGAKALVSAPPFYYHLSQDELSAYYQGLADKLPLPLFLYNMPSHTKIHFEIDTVLKLSKHPNIIGLKDSSANAPYFQKLIYLLKRNSDFSLLVGPEEILAESVLMGADGGVPGGANLFPQLYVELYEAAKQRNFSTLLPLHQMVMEISTNLYTMDSSQSSYLKGLKSALFSSELCDMYLASPLSSFKKSDRKIIAGRLENLQASLSKLINTPI